MEQGTRWKPETDKEWNACTDTGRDCATSTQGAALASRPHPPTHCLAARLATTPRCGADRRAGRPHACLPASSSSGASSQWEAIDTERREAPSPCSCASWKASASRLPASKSCPAAAKEAAEARQLMATRTMLFVPLCNRQEYRQAMRHLTPPAAVSSARDTATRPSVSSATLCKCRAQVVLHRSDRKKASAHAHLRVAASR